MSTGHVRAGLLAVVMVAAPLCLAGQVPGPGTAREPRDWSRARPLVWADFLAPPDETSRGAALTAYEIQARTICEADGPAFLVSVRFLPDQSWVKDGQRTPRILAHEQGHFDLAEVAARQLRTELAGLGLTCAAGNAAFTKQVADSQSRDGDLQRSYDTQTMFGTDASVQRVWENRIGGWLAGTSPDRRP